MFKLPAGSILFRTQTEPSPWLVFSECEETGKTGCYVTDSKKIALGIIDEKKHLSDVFYIHTYRTTRDLFFECGKYSFRELSPHRYYKENGELILDVPVLFYENTAHCDIILPILSFDAPEEYGTEYFIRNGRERSSLFHIGTEIVRTEEVKQLYLNLCSN